MRAADPHPGFLRALAETRAFQLGHPTHLQWTPDGRGVLFLRGGPRDPALALHETDVETGATRLLADPAAVLGGAPERLTDAERARRERTRTLGTGFTGFSLSPDGRHVLLSISNRLVLLERATARWRMLDVPEGEAILDPRLSPDGRLVAFVRGYDVWVVGSGAGGVGGGPARPVTSGGTPDLMHGLPEFVAEEEMGRHEGTWWAPDGCRIALAEVDQREVEHLAIVDPSAPERPPRTCAYPRAGRANARVRLGVAAVPEAGAAVAPPRWIDWDRERHPYLARVSWPARGPLCLLVQARDQREVALLAADPESGVTRPILIESDPAWVNLDRRLPAWLPDGSGFLWMTERRGRRELELRVPDGALETVVVAGEEGFLSLAGIESDGRWLWARLGDAGASRIARIEVRGAGRVNLEDDGADHDPMAAPSGEHVLDTRTAVDAWQVSVVLARDGTERLRLPSLAETPPFPVNLELVEVGARGFRAALVRPRDFDRSRRYPVLVHVYGGPHVLMVKADRRQYLLAQWLADHGCIVVSIDSRGTPGRDRAWERALAGRLATVPLEDQVEALGLLARRFPEIDDTRAGIFGWSFGGTMAALAVMRHPEVFKVAVAGAPVVDWHDYDTHYTERYLGLPAAAGDGGEPTGGGRGGASSSAADPYRESSPLTYAAELSRPLLLVHGTADDNVYFMHSLKLAQALLRAGRRFEFLPLPGVTHQIADPAIRESVWRRIADFLFHCL